MATANQDAKLTADVISSIMRQQSLTSELAFGQIWSEVASGFETYGKRDLVWTTFIREHNTDYWYKRVLNKVVKLRCEAADAKEFFQSWREA